MKTKIAFLVVVSCLSLAGLSRATEASMSCDKDAMCGPLVERARAYSSAGQLEEALRSYQAAYQLVLDPQLLFNVARVQHKLGRLKDAIDSYQRFLDSNYDADGLRERTTEFLARAREQLPPATATDKPLEPVVVADKPAARPTPFYKKSWFVALVGGVGAGVLVAGLAGGLASRNDGPYAPSAPSGALTSHPFGQ